MPARLPPDCLRELVARVGPHGACMLSMTCRALRASIRARTLDGETCLEDHGYRRCRALGMPRCEGVTAALAGLWEYEQLQAACRDGCPVGRAVALLAVRRDALDMLVWASERGAALDAGLLEEAGPAVGAWISLRLRGDEAPPPRLAGGRCRRRRPPRPTASRAGAGEA